MKKLAILTLGIMLIACTFASACGGRLFHRHSNGASQGYAGTQSFNQQGYTFQQSGCQSCGASGTFQSNCPGGVCPAPQAVKTFKSTAEIEKKLAAFAASNQCPPKGKAVIDAHLSLKTATNGAFNWQQFLADITAAAPEILAIVQDIITGL